LRITTLLSVLFLLACAPERAEPQLVQASGPHLLTANGDTLLLRGINLGNWLLPEGYMFKFSRTNSPRRIERLVNELLSPGEAEQFWDLFLANYITRSDIEYIRKLGANHIRLPFHYRLFTDEIYLGAKRNGFTFLDSTVTWCRDNDLYVLLDMHGAPGGQTGDNIDDSYGYPFLFVDSLSQAQFVDIWTRIARHYRDEESIIGYGLLNEPIAHYFPDKDALNEQLEPLYKRTLAAIREVDPGHLIWLGGAQWNSNFAVFGEPFAANLVYEFHKYWVPPQQAEIQAYVDFRQRHNVPIYMGESGENDDVWVGTFRQLLDENGIGWAFWPYKKMDNTRGPVNFPLAENWQIVVDYAEADRGSYKAMRELNVDRQAAKAALFAFVRNSHYRYSFANPGYIAALGFNDVAIP
jgi:endoglucanase